MKLIETVEMMNSNDFKERFRAEYYQLKIRKEGLANMLEKYKKVSYHLLQIVVTNCYTVSWLL